MKINFITPRFSNYNFNYAPNNKQKTPAFSGATEVFARKFVETQKEIEDVFIKNSENDWIAGTLPPNWLEKLQGKSQAEKEQTKELRRQIDELKTQLESEDIKLADLRQGSNLKRRKKTVAKTPTPKARLSSPLVVGDYASLDGNNTPCKVLEISGNMATVAMGNFQSRVAIDRLRKVNAPQEAATRHSSVSVTMSNDIRQRQLNFKPDIDVRGMRADEAIQAVTYFIDDAIQFNSKQVRILHGTGNGILRQRIREYLNTVPGVKSYRDEHVQFGGAGITVVQLD